MAEDIIDINKTYFKLAAVVDQVLNEQDLSVSHNYKRFLAAGKWYAVQLFTKYACKGVKTELLDISDTRTCIIPVDAIQVTKVGEPWYQYARTLALNDGLMLTDRTTVSPQWTDLGNPDILPNGTDVTQYGGYWFQNYGGKSLFSFGGGLPSRGFYKIVDREGNGKEMLLDEGVCTSQIYVEYITAGISPNEETILNPFTAEAVRKYLIHWYETVRRDGRSEAAIFRTGQEHWDAECTVKASRNDLSPENVLATTRKYYRLTNKI